MDGVKNLYCRDCEEEIDHLGRYFQDLPGGGDQCTKCHAAEASPYESADYYTYDDEGGRLTSTCDTEAIEHFLDNGYVPGISIQQIIEDSCPITIYAYKRDVVPPGYGGAVVEKLLEELTELWAEDYGDPDASPVDDPFTDSQAASVTGRFQSLLDDCLKNAHVWKCVPCGEKVFSEDEVTALMKKWAPELFDDS